MISLMTLFVVVLTFSFITVALMISIICVVVPCVFSVHGSPGHGSAAAWSRPAAVCSLAAS